MCLRCEPRRKLTNEEELQAYIYKTLHWGFLYGAQGYGKNMAAARKHRENVARMTGRVEVNSLDNCKLGVGKLEVTAPTKLPQKICNYRKPKLEWYGERQYGVIRNYHGSRHWSVIGDVVEEYKGKRFIGISEPTETEKMDSDFLMKFTGDDWVETRTLDVSSKTWVPQGKIFVTSGKPLKINDKSKETIERVQDITYP